MNSKHESVVVDRLGDIVVCSRLHRRYGSIHTGERSNDDDRCLPLSFVDMTQQVQAVGARHAQVGNDQLRTALINDSTSFIAVRSQLDVVARFLQLHLQYTPNTGIVVDNNNKISIHAKSRLTGSWRTIVSPLPGAFRAVSSPPCCSTILLAIASPRPLPFGLVVKNGSKIRSSWSFGMPAPS